MSITEIDVINRALETLKAKGNDYNAMIAREDYFPHGLISYHQMLHIKVLRIQSLIQSDVKPNFEGIEDSLEDLLNYTIMALMFVRNVKDD